MTAAWPIDTSTPAAEPCSSHVCKHCSRVFGDKHGVDCPHCGSVAWCATSRGRCQ